MRIDRKISNKENQFIQASFYRYEHGECKKSDSKQKIGRPNLINIKESKMKKVRGYRIVKDEVKGCKSCAFYEKINVKRQNKSRTITDIICSYLCQNCERGFVYKKNKKAQKVVL